jgi:hypothetical protein
MKEFKTKNRLFICEECLRVFKSKQILSVHINRHHNYKEYFDKWIKDDSDGKCLICDKETTFKDFKTGYRKCCSQNCTNELRKVTCKTLYGKNSISQVNKIKKIKKETYLTHYGINYPKESKRLVDKIKTTKKEKYGDENYNNVEKRKQSNLEKFGVEHALQNKEIHNKFEKTCLRKFGVKNPYQSKTIKNKIKETNLKNLGVEYPMQNKEIQEKSKQKCIQKYGVENVFQSEKIKQKSRETSLINNGVEYGMQNIEILEKSQKTRFRFHKYKNTNIWYQGSYELDFLEKYFKKLDILRPNTIKYLYENKHKYYHPDFFIPSLNLIVEIKNSYLAIRDKKQIKAKRKATISSGFNYIMIIDKDYTQFNDLIQK